MEFARLFLTISIANHSGRNSDFKKTQPQRKGFGKCFLHAKGRDGDLLTRPVIIPHNEHKFTM